MLKYYQKLIKFKNMAKKTFVLSLGGSLIVPGEEINSQFLKNFRKLIIEKVRKGNRFFIVTGGGSTTRKYIRGAKKITRLTNYDLDWIGIQPTRLNAYLVKTIFGDLAYKDIIIDPSQRLKIKEKIAIAAGWKPGWSTDYVAVMIAQRYGIDTVINLSNIKYAYTRDPKKYKNAKKIVNTDWKAFRKIVGDAWEPGANKPFDPIASKKGEQLGLKVIITDGKDIKNLSSIIEGKAYKGTTIQS